MGKNTETNYKAITNGKLNIVLINGTIEKARERAVVTAKIIDSEDGITYKCTSKDYTDATNKLCELAQDIIDKYPELDIFKYIPLTKDGNFAKGQSILLADSGITNTWNQDYFAQKKLQLRLVKSYSSEMDWIKDKPIENTLALEIDEFNAGGKTEPVFDKDGIPHEVVKTRAKYLKDNEIKAGCVYAEQKGTEYLYLGYYSIMESYEKTEKRQQTLEKFSSNEIKYAWQIPAHYYIRLTKKIRKMAEEHPNLQDFLDYYYSINNDKDKYLTDGMSVRENPRKFVEQTDTLFNNTDVSDHILYGKEKPDYEYQSICRIRPMTPGTKYII